MSILKNKPPKEFSQIPNALIVDNNLSMGARVLYCLLRSKPDNWQIYNKQICNELSISLDTIAKYWKELIQQGWLSREKQRDEKGNFTGGYDYEIRFLPDPEKVPISEKYRSAKSTEHNNIIISTNIDCNSNIDTLNKKTIQKNSTNPKNSLDEDKVFNQFWELYPRKRRGGKEESFRAWNKALKREDITPEQILAVVKIYANSDEVKRGYAKGCAAWLNGSCFLNEYQSIKATNDMNPVLEYMMKEYEPKEMLENSILKDRYIRKHSSSADELLDACEGNVERAKQMIDYYVDYIKEKGKEFFLWDVLNNFCRIHDALKFRKGGKTWEIK